MVIPSRFGFTLFEVTISLALMTFGVISVLMLLPAGLKAQQMARFQIYAAAKAEEMIEQFNGAQSANPATDNEGLAMWDVPVAHKAQSWDLESKISSHRFGIMPLPLDIAQRLDSDADEIQNIIENGGYVYYSQPLASTGMQEQGMPVSPPNEAQKLIIGVKGFAQQNALSSFPLKNWPYHTPYPSPPVHMQHMADKFLPQRKYDTTDYYNYYSWPHADIEEQKEGHRKGAGNWAETFCVPWETSPQNFDRDIQKVFDWPDDTLTEEIPDRNGNLITTKVHWGYFPYANGRLWESNRTHVRRIFKPQLKDASTFEPTYFGPEDRGGYPSRDSAKRYVATAIWYAMKKGVPLSFGSSDGDMNPYDGFSAGLSEAECGKEVLAFRFLAHATACLTGWYSYDEDEEEELHEGSGVKIPKFSADGVTTPEGARITHKMIKYYHERSLHLINLFAASYPYDWSVPRPLNRVTMMDFPLMQFDLFSPPLPYGMDISNNIPIGGYPNRPLYDFMHPNFRTKNTWDHIFGRQEVEKPSQWRVLSPELIRNIGVSAIYPTSFINPKMGLGNYYGNSHFGNFDHYNLSKPFSADERCRELIFWAVDWQSYEDFETAPSAPVDASKYPIGAPRCNWHNSMDIDGVSGKHQIPTYRNRTFDERMIDMEFIDSHLVTYRNPEKTLLFTEDPTYLDTDTNMELKMLLNKVKDKGPQKIDRQIFAGVFGADRNFNKKLDRGTLPKSVRLRAVEVARFNFYDPRVPGVAR